MPRIYTRASSFKADTTYHFRCEYCGREYSVTTTLEKEVNVSDVNRPPNSEQLVAAAQAEFKWHQDRARSLGEKSQFAVDRRSATCPHCGFLPTYMVNRGQAIFNLVLWIIIGAGVLIPLVVVGGMPPSMVIVFGLVLGIPYLLLMLFWVRRLDPNRKLMRTLRDEGRDLAAPQRPQLVFGPVGPK